MTFEELIELARNFKPTEEQTLAFIERARKLQVDLDKILDSLPPQVR